MLFLFTFPTNFMQATDGYDIVAINGQSVDDPNGPSLITMFVEDPQTGLKHCNITYRSRSGSNTYHYVNTPFADGRSRISVLVQPDKEIVIDIDEHGNIVSGPTTNCVQQLPGT